MKKLKGVGLTIALFLSQVIYVSVDHPVNVSAQAIGAENVPPFVEVLPDVSSGKAPLFVRLECNAWDEDGEIAKVEWDLEGDGVFERAKSVKGLKETERASALKEALRGQKTFLKPGIFHILAKVTDDKDSSSVSSVTIKVYSDTPFLDVIPCDREGFAYMARSGYEALFTGWMGEGSVQFEMGEAVISYEFRDQTFGKVNKSRGVAEGNVIWYYNVYENVDVRYTVYEDLLLEELILRTPMSIFLVEQSFTVRNVEYRMEEGGSIGFYNGESLVFTIPKPVMYELNNPERKSHGLHYEIIEGEHGYVLRKIIDDVKWLQKAQYPVVIDSSTEGEIGDPWEQQGLTPYGQYFTNLSEYVDPMTGHLTIRHTDYSLPGRGVDVAVTRIYTTVVAYRQNEDGSGEYIPVSTYQEAPTDLGCGWALDFPWMEIEDDQPGGYMHLASASQKKMRFVNGVWEDRKNGFVVYKNANGTYTKYRKDGVREEYDSAGRLTSMTDMNGNTITFTYAQIGYTETGPKMGLSQITDTVGRVITFTYSGGKLLSITDGLLTTTYTYSGDKLVAVTDPLGRTTTYDYMDGNSFLIMGVHYPSGGFSSYEYASVIPEAAKLAPYKGSVTENGVPTYYVYKVDSPDTVTWTSPGLINSMTSGGGRPYVLQRDDGSLVMYFRDVYVWTEQVWKCEDNDCWWETVTHTEYWIKRSVSTDQQHWSTPENVVQVKSTTGNPVVIEKRDGSLVMYYKDTYVWTERKCEWIDYEYICKTITHTEFWIYRRSSSDGITWSSPVKFLQTTLDVRNIAAIQKIDTTFLLCYTDKVGSLYYIRQITSTDGVTWTTPSNILQVDSNTGNPALIQKDTGEVYLVYRRGANVFIISKAGGGWSSPIQTTAQAAGDPCLLVTNEIVVIYKGTDNHFYRISSTNGSTWSSPIQIAPNTVFSDPSSMCRKDAFYRVTAQFISATSLDLVRVTEFSYSGDNYLPSSSDVIIRDTEAVRSSMHFEYDPEGKPVEKIAKDENGTQTEKIVYTYNISDQVIQQSVYRGTSQDISFSVTMGYDNWGNTIYSKDPEGAEHFYSYANTSCQNQFVDSEGVPVALFSDAFYTNSIPSHCHVLLVGEASINSGKVKETYYKYDVKGDVTETKVLFPTRNYSVFSGVFSEPGQTSFTIDLTGLTITNGILVISAIPIPTSETLHETHSERGKGWHNTGTWNGKSFFADYTQCTSSDCFDGQTEIGPFDHYPGSPNYTGYITWVEDNHWQYVQTNYTAIVNEYPTKVEYKLNGTPWITITSNLGAGTTSTIVSADKFLQGANTLQFRESNSYSTKFEWTLYLNQGSSPQEHITQFSYDDYGNLTSITDPLGGSVLFGYDAHHLSVTSLTNALNQTITATSDFATGLVTSVTNANGDTTFFEYDLVGRITKRIRSDLSEVEAVYNDANNTVAVYDELDHSTMYYYDCLGRLLRTEYHLSPTLVLTERYTYTYLNQLETQTSPGGHTHKYKYDSTGRLIRLTNPDSTFAQMHYDDVANTVSVLDENQHKKEYHYDWMGNVRWVKEYTDPVNYFLTQYTYDDMGQMTSFVDANGNTTSYEYDSLFGVTKVIYPDLTEETFSYDAVGNLIRRTDPQGVTSLVYDALYQLIETTFPDSASATFEYDAVGNCTRATDPNGQALYLYDERNRLLSETRTIGGNAYTIGYTYDAASRLTSLTYPDQSSVTFEYDSLDRLVRIPGYAEFTYDADSLLATMTYGNGITTTYEYNNRNRPVSILSQGNADLLSMSFQYDPVGNVTQFSYGRRAPDLQWMDSTEVFGYDWLNRLVSAQGDYGSLTYTYDAVGNRLSQNDLYYTHNNMNELLSISDGTTFTYDSSGNRIGKTRDGDEWVYTYDYANRLTRVAKNGITQGEYLYDGCGRRIQVTEDDVTTTYVYSGLNVLYEENSTGIAAYVYGPSGRIAKRTSIQGETHTFYYHADCLGSTRLVTDESQHIVTEAAYSPFGEPTTSGEEEPFLYTGKERDSTGLYYFGARYYDPEVGRFITRDLLAGEKSNPQSLNLYTYCLNNPLTYVDPAGLAPDIICNETTGYCVEFLPGGGVLVYDRNGKLVLDTNKIQKMIDEGNYVTAVKLILAFLGYKVIEEGKTTEQLMHGGEIEIEYLEVMIGNKIIHIRIYGPDDVEKLMKDEGKTEWHLLGECERLGNWQTVAIVRIFFYAGVNMTAERLFHTVGHEMEHARHHATGLFKTWSDTWNQAAAEEYSEVLAYEWNLRNLYILSFPGAREGFEMSRGKYLWLYFKRVK